MSSPPAPKTPQQKVSRGPGRPRKDQSLRATPPASSNASIPPSPSMHAAVAPAIPAIPSASSAGAPRFCGRGLRKSIPRAGTVIAEATQATAWIVSKADQDGGSVSRTLDSEFDEDNVFTSPITKKMRGHTSTTAAAATTTEATASSTAPAAPAVGTTPTQNSRAPMVLDSDAVKRLVEKRQQRAALKAKFVVRSFDQVVTDEGLYLPSSSQPNCLTIAAAPSDKPRRFFCSICGYKASYTCPRCGARFCCAQCSALHKEATAKCREEIVVQ